MSTRRGFLATAGALLTMPIKALASRVDDKPRRIMAYVGTQIASPSNIGRDGYPMRLYLIVFDIADDVRRFAELLALYHKGSLSRDSCLRKNRLMISDIMRGSSVFLNSNEFTIHLLKYLIANGVIFQFDGVTLSDSSIITGD